MNDANTGYSKIKMVPKSSKRNAWQQSITLNKIRTSEASSGHDYMNLIVVSGRLYV